MTPVFYVLLRRMTGNRPLVQHNDNHPQDEDDHMKVAAE
jgi:multidrug efflux pump